MNDGEQALTRGEIFRRLSRIERHPDVLTSLFGPMAAHAGQSVEQVVAVEASAIYADALGMASLTRLDKAVIRCRCDIARLTVVRARAHSPVGRALNKAYRELARVETARRRADLELLAWILARLPAQEGWPSRLPGLDP